ncbi:MAG: DUF1579 domain-containing protein [Bacteroidota bacterium]|nr:DUF1579 domain-containing protein [Bacteroidota bacterium]
MSQKFQDSLQQGAHAQLKSFVGTYTGTSNTWFEPGDPIDTSQVTGTLRMVLGDRFLMHEYSGSMEGKPLEGIALIGFSLGENRWQIAWLDSFHNGTRIMLSESSVGSDPSFPNVIGTYPAPPGPSWGWRTTIEKPAEDRLVITHYNISPEGEEVKAVEFDYKKTG